MSEELKPCPFCGGEAYYWRGNESGLYMVGCNNGSCRGYVMGDTKRIGLESAVEAWNRRAERTCTNIYDQSHSSFGCANGFECSECGNTIEDAETYAVTGTWNYCSKCGAKVVQR